MNLIISIILLLVLLPIQGFAADQGRIIFSTAYSGKWDLWSVGPDGKNLRQVTDTNDDEHSPAVSPDGKEILFIDAKRALWIMNSDGSNRVKMPVPLGFYAQPTWAPGGDVTAFVKYMVTPTDESELWTIKRRKSQWTDLERISEFPPMRLYPSFSPDGTMLAYTQFRRDKVVDVVEEIGILVLGERKFKAITNANADSFKPVWSPDGKQIAYTSNKAGNYDIWILSLRDGKERRLTRHPGYDGEPTWSPKGDEIAFVSTRSGNKELWVVSVAGGQLRQLTRLKNTVKEPFWIK
jgi:TolB protein